MKLMVSDKYICTNIALSPGNIIILIVVKLAQQKDKTFQKLKPLRKSFL